MFIFFISVTDVVVADALFHYILIIIDKKSNKKKKVKENFNVTLH